MALARLVGRLGKDAELDVDDQDPNAVIAAMLFKNHMLVPPASMSPRKQKWDLLMLTWVLFDMTTIPLQLAWPHQIDGSATDAIDVFIDGCFWIDMVLSFRTAFLDEQGDLVADWRRIGRRYATSWFAVDLVATIPWSRMASDRGGGALGVLKLPRLFRLSRLLQQLEGMRAANLMRAVKLLVGFFLVAHWVGCLWWIIGTSDAGLDSTFGVSWLLRAGDCEPLRDDGDTRARAADALHAWRHDRCADGDGSSSLEGAWCAPWAGGRANRTHDVLTRNWRHVWCESGEEGAALATFDGGATAPDARAQHTFEAQRLSINPALLYHGDLAQQYFSSFYWALSMLMKTAYVGPDTLAEKMFGCLGVLLGACAHHRSTDERRTQSRTGTARCAR